MRGFPFIHFLRFFSHQFAHRREVTKVLKLNIVVIAIEPIQI